MINLHSIPYFLTAATSILLGAYVFFRNIKGKLNRAWGLLSCSTFLWSLGFGLTLFSQTKTDAILWGRLSHIGASLVPVTYLHFILALIGKIKQKKNFLFLSYTFGILFAAASISSFIIRDLKPKLFFNYYFQPGFLYPGFAIMFFALVSFAIYELFYRLKTTSGTLRNQLTYVIIASLLGFGAGATTFPLVFDIPLYPLGGIVIFYNIIITFAIIRYRLMDVRIAITRAGTLTFVYTLVLGVPFFVGGLLKKSSFGPIYNWWALPVFLMAVLASAGPFIYMRLQRRIESRMRAQEFESHQALRRLSQNMLRFTNLEDLLKLIVHHLIKILRLKFAAIYLVDEKSDKYVLRAYWRPEQSLQTTFKPPAEFSVDSCLVRDLYTRRLPVVTEELRLYAPKEFSPHVKELIASLSALKANTVIPSFLRNNLLGFLVLSNKRTNQVFTQEDLNLLMVLSNEAALAIENAQFHQKEKITLVEKSRREALADMAPGASHQFNNRLAAISSSAELLLLKLESVKIDGLQDEKARKVLTDAKAALELIGKETYKGKEITSAILKRAKAKVDFQEVDITALIKNAHRLVTISHSRSGLGKFKQPGFKMTLLNEISRVFVSEALLQDCFYNLIDNSFAAVEEKQRRISQGESHLARGVTFQGEIEVVLKQEYQGLVIRVKDNGIGLTKENKKKLFTPYFTTKATSNKGSGLGLYVIRDFIEMHHGSIACDSEYGQGATFTIKLPVKKGTPVKSYA